MPQIALERPAELPPAGPSLLAPSSDLPADEVDRASFHLPVGRDLTAGAVAALSDGDGFAVAYRDHHDAVVAAARRICGPHQAADVAQDVFFVLARHPEKFDPERGSLRSFLLAIAHHRAVDVVRSEKARQAREERIESEERSAPPEVDDDLLRGEGGTRIRAALAQLPAQEREAITAAFYGHCSYRQAAARLGQPEGTIKSRIRTGFQRLRPLLTTAATT